MELTWPSTPTCIQTGFSLTTNPKGSREPELWLSISHRLKVRLEGREEEEEEEAEAGGEDEEQRIKLLLLQLVTRPVSREEVGEGREEV